MKMQTLNWNKIFGCSLVFLFCATIQIHAQAGRGGGGGGGFGGNRGGGGTGGFGGFGGFGGGGFGGATGGANGFGARASTTTSSQYNNNGSVGSAQISVDPDTHNLVIIADKETMEQIREVLQNLDSPKPQVFIKTVFMEVQHNNSSDIGVQGGWAAGNNSAGTVVGSSGLNTVVTNFSALGKPMSAALAQGGTTPAGAFAEAVGGDFQATLKAIAQAGNAEVLSRPSILARDGQAAQIVVGQQIYLPSGVSFGSAGNTGTTIPTINGSYQNVGIILNVTPFIGDNGLVQMILQPQTSEVDLSTPGQVIVPASGLFSSSVTAPNINIRSANTVVVTPDGQTVVIGGLIGNNNASNESKVPFLGDIPLLGNLFKEKTKSGSKQELLIFLTPHIVEAPSQLSAMSSTETHRSDMITNSISEQELDQYLERVPVKTN